jgi:hypothetical protein
MLSHIIIMMGDHGDGAPPSRYSYHPVPNHHHTKKHKPVVPDPDVSVEGEDQYASRSRRDAFGETDETWWWFFVFLTLIFVVIIIASSSSYYYWPASDNSPSPHDHP